MILPKIFYIMRHGQSVDNELGLISGSGSDPHLTDLGREQARIAQKHYNKLEIKPSKIVVSALKRTHQTAELVVGHIDFIEDPDLNERYLGELDGKITESEQKLRKQLPGEESGGDHAKRVISAINRYLESDEQVLFVCHGGTIRRVLEALNLANAVHVENAVIYKFVPHGNHWHVYNLHVDI